ncbi:MAG: ATP synthase subunit I [Candidatus Electrothrix sp. YB6]
MNKQKSGAADEYPLVRRVEQFNVFLVLLLSLGSWYFFGRQMAVSVLCGGILSGGSFFLLKRTVRQIVDKIAAAPEQQVQQGPTALFAVRFYGRLLVLVLLLAVLGMSVEINIIGLTVGLSTVAVSVIIVPLARSCMEFSGEHKSI